MKKEQSGLQAVLHSKFYRVYFAVVALAIAAIIIGLNWLTGVVRDYEAAQPKYVADDVADMFREGRYDELYALDTSAQSIADGDAGFYAQSLRELTTGKDLQVSEGFSASADERVYNVKLDGGKFASFTLVPSGETTGHGNKLWKLGSVSTNVVTKELVDPSAMPYRIKVPAGCVVTVDGEALTEEHITKASVDVLPADFLPDDVTPPTLTEYGFDAEGDTPAIQVTDAQGNAMQVQPDGDQRWLVPAPENATFRQKYGKAMIQLAQKIAKYTTKDLSQGSMLSNCASDSPAETIIKKFSNYWAPSHKSVSFKNASVSECYVVSKNCFTCKVHFDYVLTSRRNNDYVYPTDYTLCIIKRGKSGKLYNVVFY